LGVSLELEKSDGDFQMSQIGFDSGYLLVETHGVAKSQGKEVDENPITNRFDVADAESTL
jgi:hypothetical protein